MAIFEKVRFWAARDLRGDLFIYNSLPERRNGHNIWGFKGGELDKNIAIRIDINLLRNLSWEDEPVEVRLDPKLVVD